MTEVAANGNHLGEKIDRDSTSGNAGGFFNFTVNVKELHLKRMIIRTSTIFLRYILI